MSLERPLRGGCQCGRNRYIIERPKDASQLAQVIFDTGSSHRISLASPLAAFIRVPLEWYHSTTFAFFPDETNAMIRKLYTHPSQQFSKRHFCGFCGTPLSYWSEQPRSEADFISLTLGSLCREDLGDLEDMGLIPDGDSPTPGSSQVDAAPPASQVVTRESRGVPWFDTLVEGSQLGNVRTSKGSGQSRDGRVTYEWEVVEWTANDDGLDAPSPAKRQRQDTGDADAAMEDPSR